MERMETRLVRELTRSRHINAKREVEALNAIANPDKKLLGHWEGQETALKSLLEILDKPAS